MVNVNALLREILSYADRKYSNKESNHYVKGFIQGLYRCANSS